MEKKHGKYPANARVDIDYTGKKPKIDFSYPDNGKTPKQQAQSQHRTTPIAYYSGLIILSIFLFLLVPYTMSTENTYPEDCNISWDKYTFSSQKNISIIENGSPFNYNTSFDYARIDGANITCDNGNYSISFMNYGSKVGNNGFYFNGSTNLFTFNKKIIFIILYVFLSLLFMWAWCRMVSRYLLEKEWYQKWFPESQAKRCSKSTISLAEMSKHMIYSNFST